MKTVADKRNYGIDLLRIVSMFMVVILHILGCGGILGAEGSSFSLQAAAWLLEIMCFCAVNCYAMISGYVGIDSKFRISNLLQLWLQGLFYTVLITLLFAIFAPQYLGDNDWVNALLPVTTGQYWYLTAYIPLYLLSPVINAGLKSVSARMLGCIVVVSSLLMIVMPTIILKDPYAFKSGYSFVWLLYMYIVGGCIRKCGVLEKLTTGKALCCYAATILLTWAPNLMVDIIRYSDRIVSFSFDSIKYTIPTVFLAAFSLFVVFARLDIGETGAKIIKTLSPLVFGVYLIHTHPLIFRIVLGGAFVGYAELDIHFMLLSVLGTAVGIYAVCMLLEKCRQLLFRLTRINKLIALIDDKFNRYLDASE